MSKWLKERVKRGEYASIEAAKKDPVKTSTLMVGDDMFVMKKSEVILFIVHRDNRVFVVNTTHRCIPYVYIGSKKGSKKAYHEILGKLLRKRADSKYFRHPKREESAGFGKPGKLSPKEWTEYINTVLFNTDVRFLIEVITAQHGECA